MGEIRWYRRDPNRAINGMSVLTLEECGAYNLVLDLIYSRDGNLVDNDAEIAHFLRVDTRVWRRIRRRLIDLEKLYIHSGKLRNPAADKEIDYALSKIAKAREAGLKSAAKKQEQRRNAKDLESTEAQRLFQLERYRHTKK